jgi:hypothetical protein
MLSFNSVGGGPLSIFLITCSVLILFLCGIMKYQAQRNIVMFKIERNCYRNSDQAQRNIEETEDLRKITNKGNIPLAKNQSSYARDNKKS